MQEERLLRDVAGIVELVVSSLAKRRELEGTCVFGVQGNRSVKYLYD